MSDTPAPFESYPCSLGTVIGHEGGSYVISTPDGRVIGIRANSEPSAESVEADIASPYVPAVPLRQSVRVVIARMTDAEKDALRACNVTQIVDAYDVALVEGVISEADPQFPQFAAALDQLGIVTASRWSALLAP